MLTAGAEDDVRLEELALVVALDAHEVGAVVHAAALVARYRRCNGEEVKNYYEAFRSLIMSPRGKIISKNSYLQKWTLR